MDIIFSSLPIDKINKDKTLDLQEIQQIYNFLLTNDYYIFSDYALVNKLFNHGFKQSLGFQDST